METPGGFLFSFSWFCSVLSRDGGKNLKEKEFLPSSGSCAGPMLMPILVFTIYVFIFGCTGSSLLCLGFLQFRWVGAPPPRGPGAYCAGFSCCRAQAPGGGSFGGCSMWAQSCVSWALELAGLSTRGTQALAVSRGPWSTRASVLVAHGL